MITELPNEFAARSGARISDSDANLIGLELRLITKPGTQGPTAAEVVDAASHQSSPLHSFFDWSDKSAAKKWRLHYARVLIGSIVPITYSGQKVEIRAFNAIELITAAEDATRKHAKRYVELKTIKSDKALKAQIKAQCFAELLATLKKFHQYTELWPDFRKQCIVIEDCIVDVSAKSRVA